MYSNCVSIGKKLDELASIISHLGGGQVCITPEGESLGDEQ